MRAPTAPPVQDSAIASVFPLFFISSYRIRACSSLFLLFTAVQNDGLGGATAGGSLLDLLVANTKDGPIAVADVHSAEARRTLFSEKDIVSNDISIDLIRPQVGHTGCLSIYVVLIS